MIDDEAIKLYFKMNRRASKMLSRIRLWDSTKTLSENAKALGVTIQNAKSTATSYALPFKRANAKTSIIPIDDAVVTRLFQQGMPLSRIASMYQTTRQNLSSRLRAKKRQAPSSSPGGMSVPLPVQERKP